MKIKVNQKIIIPIEFKVVYISHYECGNVEVGLSYKIPYNHPAMNVKSKKSDLVNLKEQTILELKDLEMILIRNPSSNEGEK